MAGDSTPRRSREREPTCSLLVRAGRGDDDAQEELYRHYWARLRRWAHGRLPGVARERADTDDLVQIVLLNGLKRLATFRPHHRRAFSAYLHQALMNHIRDEIRYSRRRPFHGPPPDELPASRPDPFDTLRGRELLGAYSAALRHLRASQQRAVVMRVELGFSFRDIARALGSPSAGAARMVVFRALRRLAALMGTSVLDVK